MEDLLKSDGDSDFDLDDIDKDIERLMSTKLTAEDSAGNLLASKEEKPRGGTTSPTREGEQEPDDLSDEIERFMSTRLSPVNSTGSEQLSLPLASPPSDKHLAAEIPSIEAGHSSPPLAVPDVPVTSDEEGRELPKENGVAVPSDVTPPICVQESIPLSTEASSRLVVSTRGMEHRGSICSSTASVFEPQTVDCWPYFDVSENGSHVCVSVDLPGMSAESFLVEFHGRNLVVQGSRDGDPVGTEFHPDARLVVQGRYEGGFFQTIRLPHRLDRRCVEAEFENGVLTVKVCFKAKRVVVMPRIHSFRSQQRPKHLQSEDQSASGLG